jgi:hypothetical protein
MDSTSTWIFSYPRSEDLFDGGQKKKYEDVTYRIGNRLRKNLQLCQIKDHVILPEKSLFSFSLFLALGLRLGDDRGPVVLNSQLRKGPKHRRKNKTKRNF